MTGKELIKSSFYPILATISTFSILISSFNLMEASKSIQSASREIKPIAKWAESQNDCITRTFRIGGKNTRGLSSKVWSCNGGGY